jgi:hypothetical protein
VSLSNVSLPYPTSSPDKTSQNDSSCRWGRERYVRICRRDSVPRWIIFLKVLKIKSVLCVHALMVFNFICILIVKKNIFLSSCLLLWKHLLILEIKTLVAPQRELETSIQPLKNTSANHLPVILKSNTENRFKICWMFHHHHRITEQFTESHVASWMPHQAFWRGFQ